MINKKLLKPCDILLFRETHRSTWIQRLIVWGQCTFYHVPKQARYCHVALVAGDTNLLVEAVWPKTHITTIDFSTYKNREQIEVCRIKDLTDAQREKILTWAYSHTGEWYDVLLLLTGWLSIRHTEICSVFVSKACKAAGLEIPHMHRKSGMVLPDDYVEFNTMLERVM
jgi:uncharacterized protein YycO